MEYWCSFVSAADLSFLKIYYLFKFLDESFNNGNYSHNSVESVLIWIDEVLLVDVSFFYLFFIQFVVDYVSTAFF